MTVDRLMDQTESTRRAHQDLEPLSNLVVVVGGQELHDDTHGPAVARTLMRAANGIDDGSVSIVGVGLAEDEVAGVLIDFVGGVLETEVRDTQK